MNTMVRRLAIWTVRGAVLALTLMLLACAPEMSHQVLTFFFDGVPPLGSEQAAPPTMADLNAEDRTGMSPLEASPMFASLHQPYAKRACVECHQSQDNIMQVPSDQTLCLRCHGGQQVSEQWNHGPLNFGLCSICHVPHLSQFPDLQTEAQPGLCVRCHDSSTLMDDFEEHVGREETRCTACHDPHRRGVYVDAEEQLP